MSPAALAMSAHASARTMVFPVGSPAVTAGDSAEALCITADGRVVRCRLPAALLAALWSSAEHADPGPALRAELQAARPPQKAAVDLSRRECETLTLLASGRSYKQIAADLDISLDTVRSYIRTLYRKLGAHSATEVIARARSHGLV